jgi:hypothetical protein
MRASQQDEVQTTANERDSRQLQDLPPSRFSTVHRHRRQIEEKAMRIRP